MDVWEADWRTALSRISTRFASLEDHEVVIYLDPPYVDKAAWLYEWSFESAEHADLASALLNETSYRWLLSYDDHDEVRDLYCGRSGQTTLHVSHRYTAAGSETRTVKDELLVTNLPLIPKSDRYRTLDTQNPTK